MYNIDTLARLTRLTRRTIRYYVQRGVLEPPQGGGRGSFYTEEHRSRLEQIKAWSDQGVPLIHMRDLTEGREPSAGDPQPFTRSTVTGSTGSSVRPEKAEETESYERFRVVEGVEIHFSPGRLQHEDLEEILRLIGRLIERKSHVD